MMESIFLFVIKMRGKLGLTLHKAISILIALAVLLLAFIGFVVWRRISPLASGCVLGMILIQLWMRLSQWAGYGTPPLSESLQRQALYEKGQAVRIVALSDTHNTLDPSDPSLIKRLPDGDILVHCGDISVSGDVQSIKIFNEFLGKVKQAKKFKAIVVIAGNHDICCSVQDAEENVQKSYASFQAQWNENGNADVFRKELLDPVAKALSRAEVTAHVHRTLLSNATHYLEHDIITIEIPGKNSITIAGTPTTDFIAGGDHHAAAFTSAVHQSRMESMFSDIVKQNRKIDVLLTHGPPRFSKRAPECYIDYTFMGMHVGSSTISRWLSRMQRNGIAPKFHVSGHIHESRGVARDLPFSALDGADDQGMSAEAKRKPLDTTFVSASSVNLMYNLRPGNDCAIAFDVPVSELAATAKK